MTDRRHRLRAVVALAVLTAPLEAGAAKPVPPIPADPAIAYGQRETSGSATLDNVWVMNYDGQRKTRLLAADSASNGYRDASLDPTGAAIAASRAASPTRDLWAWDILKNTANGSVTPTAVNRRMLARDASCSSDPAQAICQYEYGDSAWSPSGMNIAAALNPSFGDPSSGMLRVWTWTNAARTTGSYETLYMPPEQAQISSPSWSPDGTQVVFVRSNSWTNAPLFQEVCVVDWPGPPGGWTACTPVPTDTGSACHGLRGVTVRWNPGSATPRLARGLGMPSRSGLNAIVFQDDGGCSSPIDRSPFYYFGLSWTPDARALLFTSAVDDGRRGATTYRLHQLCVDGADPVAGPNRRLLLYQGTVPAFELDRRRVDPAGTPNICDDPAALQG